MRPLNAISHRKKLDLSLRKESPLIADHYWTRILLAAVFRLREFLLRSAGNSLASESGADGDLAGPAALITKNEAEAALPPPGPAHGTGTRVALRQSHAVFKDVRNFTVEVCGDWERLLSHERHHVAHQSRGH
ncbi:hypothetical protein [Streptomyces sp. SHP 1-2]|uniref:hypothetical protein n=1 Tax=Streptomyces sp. SHP 1-2 TaxID=2769489 RepID=UPI0022382515|nr:hypothetical protein [Streptomyces sp. SHP 1-2]MCW5254104.1 hypothetical protein [Streptomyces sp. SHP 1-2]